MKQTLPPVSVQARGGLINRWDLLAILLVAGLLVFLAEASRNLGAPLEKLAARPISLDPANLPDYAARTTLRMLAALGLSLLFTFTYATLAAKSRRAEQILVPLLDILQSVPILGFISVTVVFFLSLAPGRVLGAELAAVFAIFTSQAWNMAFSFYQSLRTVPTELAEAATSFRLSPWMRFWRLEVPFAMPALVWNMMMSMSGGWFFVVAAEAISVGDTTVDAARHRLLHRAGHRAARPGARSAGRSPTMLVVILIYDQLCSGRWSPGPTASASSRRPAAARPRSWVLTTLRRSRAGGRRSTAPLGARVAPHLSALAAPARAPRGAGPLPARTGSTSSGTAAWRAGGGAGGAGGSAPSCWPASALAEVARAVGLGCLTMLRVIVLIALASLIWVPIGRAGRPAAGRGAAGPAGGPVPGGLPGQPAVPGRRLGIVTFHLSPDIWLSPLMILGTQWYILFNVIAGASALPGELRDVATNLRLRGWQWWRRLALPGVLPFYVTGAITASGGSWNASIVAEAVSWGDTSLYASGLGSYIAEATAAGDFHRIVLGIVVMSGFVVVINRVFWRPLYWYAERKFRLA